MQARRSAIDVVDSTGARFRRGAVWLALTLCVAASVAEAQTTRETIEASDASAVAVRVPQHFDPYARDPQQFAESRDVAQISVFGVPTGEA